MLKIKSSDVNNFEGIEILTIDLAKCTVISVYKPPNVLLTFYNTDNFNNSKTKIIIGHFNSYHTERGYKNINDDGDRVGQFSGENMLHDSKLPPSFYSARWKREYNLDLIMVSKNIRQWCVKTVAKSIPQSQHLSIVCSINATIIPTIVPMKRRFDWNDFSTNLDSEISNLTLATENYDTFVNIVERLQNRMYNGPFFRTNRTHAYIHQHL